LSSGDSLETIHKLSVHYGIEVDEVADFWDTYDGNLNVINRELKKIAEDGVSVKFTFMAKSIELCGAGYFELSSQNEKPNKLKCALMSRKTLKKVDPSADSTSFLVMLKMSDDTENPDIVSSLQEDLPTRLHYEENGEDKPGLLSLARQQNPSRALSPGLSKSIGKIVGDAKIICDLDVEPMKVEVEEYSEEKTATGITFDDIELYVDYILAPINGTPVSQLELDSKVLVSLKDESDLNTYFGGSASIEDDLKTVGGIASKIVKMQHDQEKNAYRFAVLVNQSVPAILEAKGDVKIGIPVPVESEESLKKHAEDAGRLEREIANLKARYNLMMSFGGFVVVAFLFLMAWYILF